MKKIDAYTKRHQRWANTVDSITGESIEEGRVKKISSYLNLVDSETGLSNGQINAQKGAKTRELIIDSDSGLPLSKAVAQKVLHTLKTTIDPITNKSKYDLMVEKRNKTLQTICPLTGLSKSQAAQIKAHSVRMNKIDIVTGKTFGELKSERDITAKNKRRIVFPDGRIIDTPSRAERREWKKMIIDPETNLSLWDLQFVKKSQTMQNIDPVTGLTKQQTATKRTMETLLLLDIETGLTRMERNWRDANKQRQFNKTAVFYQSSYELQWLNVILSMHGELWFDQNVKNGVFLKGMNGLNYLPDFIIGNKIYEIKSNWTYNRRGKDLMLQSNNHKKWQLCIDSGYEIIVVLDGINHTFINDELKLIVL